MEWTQIPDLSEILLSLGKHPTQGPDMPEGTLPTAPGRIIEALVACAPRGLMAKELAQLLYLSPGCISQTVQGLVLEGLVVREEDVPAIKSEMAGLNKLRMTDKGMERYRYHHDKINGILDHLLRDVSAEDRATFERVLAIALEEGKKLRAAQAQGAGK